MSSGMFDLTGKVVVSTGANSGIGLAFLHGCAKQGADVVVWGRRADKNAVALEELKAMGAPRVHAEAVDVSDEAAVDAAFASTLDVMGRVDCVFANAGFQNRAESFPDMTSEMYHDLLNVNLHGAFYTLRATTRKRKGSRNILPLLHRCNVRAIWLISKVRRCIWLLMPPPFTPETFWSLMADGQSTASDAGERHSCGLASALISQ
jgi:NAD(P)-dependent dehydrogenase (short-subunit alcohol dehydrogenase family)